MLSHMASRHSYRGYYAQRPHTQANVWWTLLTLALGAAAGMGLASYLSRRDRLQPEDPETPLFI